MRRIVVGVDGSAPAAAALARAAGLARSTGAELVAARAFQPAEAELPPERDRAERAEAAERLRGWVAEVPGVGPGVRLAIEEGDPTSALLQRAETESAELVVVGTRGAGGFAGLHIGSVAHHLAHHITRPLGLVPIAGADRPTATVVVGVDGSAGSDEAIAWLAGIAGGAARRVVAVHAAEPSAERVHEPDPEGWRHRTEREVEVWLKPVRDTGVETEVVVVRDSQPVAAIERVATDEDADLVVVGTRGLGGFTGLRLGRVPFQLVQRLDRPVVMVPSAD